MHHKNRENSCNDKTEEDANNYSLKPISVQSLLLQITKTKLLNLLLSCKPEQLLFHTIDEDCREVHEDIASRQQTVAIYTSVRSLVLVYCLMSPQRVIGPIIGQRLLAISVRLLSLSVVASSQPRLLLYLWWQWQCSRLNLRSTLPALQ